MFNKLENKAIATRLGCISCVNIWKDSITYDELTINERQKTTDALYTHILDEIRRGCPTSESIQALTSRVIEGTVVAKFEELCEAGTIPVCLFPTRKACDKHNLEMLNNLDTNIHKIPCIDEIDETLGARRWSKRSAEQLKKLNKDCNLTAGLEAELVVAVGARVMLRRNIDTKKGLVNGAVGTVLNITRLNITVKFDHIHQPCPIEMVRSKFLLLKSFHVYRKQFPLILAYAVTIHKCQGLSLDCAIVDLSREVFCAVMTYVALSRVRSLNGLHLINFDPASIIVSSTCLEEVNRLRSLYRKDLPSYDIPKLHACKSRKRKFDCLVNEPNEEFAVKKPKHCIRPSSNIKNTATKKAKHKVSNCVHKRKVNTVERNSEKEMINNRLRSCFRKGLALYEIPINKKEPVKRQLVDACEEVTPAKNKTKMKPTSKAKKQTDDKLNSIHVAKKAKVTCVENDCNIISVERPVASRHEWTDYRYHPVNEDWQRRACELLGIQFIRPFQ